MSDLSDVTLADKDGNIALNMIWAEISTLILTKKIMCYEPADIENCKYYQKIMLEKY